MMSKMCSAARTHTAVLSCLHLLSHPANPPNLPSAEPGTEAACSHCLSSDIIALRRFGLHSRRCRQEGTAPAFPSLFASQVNAWLHLGYACVSEHGLVSKQQTCPRHETSGKFDPKKVVPILSVPALLI